MNRREYLQSVGVSFFAPSLAKQEAKNDSEENEKRPVYYSATVDGAGIQILHISIPEKLLNESNYIRSKVGSRVISADIRSYSASEPWELVNIQAQNEEVHEVSVGGVEAKQWDTVELGCMGVRSTGGGEYDFLEVFATGQPVHIESRNKSWSFGECEYERVKVFSDQLFVMSGNGKTTEPPVFEVGISV